MVVRISRDARQRLSRAPLVFGNSISPKLKRILLRTRYSRRARTNHSFYTFRSKMTGTRTKSFGFSDFGQIDRERKWSRPGRFVISNRPVRVLASFLLFRYALRYRSSSLLWFIGSSRNRPPTSRTWNANNVATSSACVPLTNSREFSRTGQSVFVFPVAWLEKSIFEIDFGHSGDQYVARTKRLRLRRRFFWWSPRARFCLQIR